MTTWALLFTLHVAAAPLEPLAVAPWQNLNADASLRWLEQGAAETIAADLKKSGVATVERAQIAEALTQVAAQQRDDVTRAVAAGKIVGARSIVLGSFQRSGADVRLIARIVDVESGTVAEAAKITGKLDAIFDLQDQVVTALTQKPRPRRARSKGRPVAAYEKLSLSLTATTDGEKRALLDEALKLDPDLVYAKDALAALEARLRAAEDKSAPAFDERERLLTALVGATDQTAEKRQGAARALLDELAAARRFHALVRVSEQVLATRLPADLIDDINERASAARVLALARLWKVDLALQAGERHLAAFPTGAHRADVEKLVRDLVDDRRTLPQRQSEYAAELAELKSDPPHDVVTADFKPCIAAKWSRLPDEMIARCTTFLARHGKDADPDARDHALAARAFIAWGHALRAEFKEAQAAARALEADSPGALDSTGLRSVVDRWSTD